MRNATHTDLIRYACNQGAKAAALGGDHGLGVIVEVLANRYGISVSWKPGTSLLGAANVARIIASETARRHNEITTAYPDHAEPGRYASDEDPSFVTSLRQASAIAEWAGDIFRELADERSMRRYGVPAGA